MHSGGVTTTSDLGQVIPVTPGKEYRLSLFNKTITTSTGKGSRIWCYWKDAENNSLYDIATDAIMRPSQYLKSETWQEFSISVFAPPEAAAFYLEVRTNTNSIAFWDDFKFEEQITTSYRETTESLIRIYPNPASDKVHLTGLAGGDRILLYDLNGRLIWQSLAKDGQLTLAVGDLPSGTYLLSVQSPGKRMTRKLMVP